MYPTTLPPSSKTVLEILDAGGAMTHKDLVERSRLAPRTVRYALKKLKERHLIIEKFNFRDARQIIYQQKPTEQSEAPAAAV
jgi:DNA-binding MarR family transcriptional regulator